MELNEKEAHCVARLLQGGFWHRHNTVSVNGEPFGGCMFCKYAYDEDDNPSGRCCAALYAGYDPSNFFKNLMDKLESETGVLIRRNKSESILPGSHTPYKKLLKNANPEITKACKDYFTEF